MPLEVVCPHCLRSVPLGETPASMDTLASLDIAHTIETLIPGTLCTDDPQASGAHGVLLATPPPFAGDYGHHFAGIAGTGPAPDGPGLLVGSSEFDPLASPVGDPALEAFEDDAPAAGTPGDALETLTLSRDSVEARRPLGPPLAIPAPPAPGPPARDDAECPPERTSPIFVLLWSYASAATLAIFYLIWTGQGRPAPSPPTLPADSLGEPSGQARVFPPLDGDRVVGLGKSLTLADLEITPLSIARGTVSLERFGADRSRSTTPGEAGCWTLRVRFRNVGDRSDFAPLEPSFVRRLDRGFSESAIQAGPAAIEMYPLAVASEQGIVGQSFARLQPGESRDTIVVCEPPAKRLAAGGMTWRLKVRVDPDHTAVVGVPFRAEDVR